MRSALLIGSLVFWAVSGVTSGRAAGQEVTAGQALYREHCSTCHGLVAPEGAERRLPEPAWALVRVALGAARMDGERVAIAPPYGPTLRGIFGRPAGSIEGFAYSRAFKQIMHGVVWDRHTLDRWMTDSQAWVPGSLMFYAQPDAEVRRKILTYLQTMR